jgi:NitT/TauT family transport system substrate-binding protein
MPAIFSEFRPALLGVLIVTVIIHAVSVTPAAAEKLRIGTLPVVDTLPLIVGQTEGLFSQQGLQVELTPFQSALERDAALQAGKLDGYFGDLLNTVLLIRAGQKIKIVATAFHTHPQHRMFGVVASPGAGRLTVAQLKGRQVAISRATVIEYLLDRILVAEGFAPDHVAKLEIKKIPVRLQMLLADQVPAALLPEPLLTLAESKGAHVVADDRQLETSETILALDAGRIAADPTLTERFQAAYGQAVARINQEPDAYKTLLVERTRFPLPIKDRFQMPVFPDPVPPSPRDVAAVQDWLAQNGLIKARLPYATIVQERQR